MTYRMEDVSPSSLIPFLIVWSLMIQMLPIVWLIKLKLNRFYSLKKIWKHNKFWKIHPQLQTTVSLLWRVDWISIILLLIVLMLWIFIPWVLNLSNQKEMHSFKHIINLILESEKRFLINCVLEISANSSNKCWWNGRRVAPRNQSFTG